jgi:competence protein ComEC
MSAYGMRVVAGATLLGALLLAFLPFHRPISNISPRMQRVWVTTLDPGIVTIDGGPRALATFQQDIAPGSHLLVRARIEPLDDARNPGEPSERAIEGERGITARLGAPTVLVIDARPSQRFDARLARLRAFALQTLRIHLREPGASIVAGELWGDRSAMSPELRAEFQETGTVHVLVTAGLHVGLACALVLMLFTALRIPRVSVCAIAIAIAWAFTLMSGDNLPAVRAATMASVALTARAFGRATFSWNALAIAAVVVLAHSPTSVTSASFWLSFCCVGAIFALVEPLESIIERIDLPHRVREAIVLTLATQLGTWPITAAVFLQFSPYSVLANIAIVPIVPVTMALGALQLVATPFPAVAQAIANLNAWPLTWTMNLVHVLATLPAAAIPMTPAPVWCIAVYEAMLLAAAWLFARGAREPGLALLLFAASLVINPPESFDSRLRITVLDVGQADSIVIETPAHQAILVDGGGRLERGPQGSDSVAERVGERIVAPFLLRQGIHSLDALIISHPHGDHVGGCAPVLRKIRVAEIADGGQVYGGHAYHDCLDTAAAQHVSIVHPRAGDVWRTNDGVTLRFIGPSLPFIGGKNAINDNSVAFILEYKHFRMLFTGDAGVAAERRFLDEGIELHVDILKVGHHGSAYSSSPEFIAAVHPRYAIISVGRHNLFGHPHRPRWKHL